MKVVLINPPMTLLSHEIRASEPLDISSIFHLEVFVVSIELLLFFASGMELDGEQTKHNLRFPKILITESNHLAIGEANGEENNFLDRVKVASSRGT